MLPSKVEAGRPIMKLGWCICLPVWAIFLYVGLAVGRKKGLFEVILFL